MLNNPSIRQSVGIKSVGIHRQSGPPEREIKKAKLVESNRLDDAVDPLDKLLTFSPEPKALPATVTVTVPSPPPVSLIARNTEIKSIVAEYGLFVDHDI